MAGQRIRTMVTRQWEIITLLAHRRHGMTARQICEATGASRATVYRDLRTLSDAGAPISSTLVNGEVRWQLVGAAYPPLAPTSLQVAALHLARNMMMPFAGTRLVTELDALLGRLARAPAAADDTASPAPAPRAPRPREPPPRAPRLGPPPAMPCPDRVQLIDRAIHGGRRIAFAYQSVSQSGARLRRVDPISIRLHDGQLYLLAHDVERQDLRTFKIARARDITILEERAEPHPEYDEDALFAHSAKVWTGEPVQVTVRLSARVARFAAEWPLTAAQTIEPGEDGAVLIHARVSGTVEAMRWVLSWGHEAEALSPPELRQAVQSQLAHALARYRREEVSHDS